MGLLVVIKDTAGCTSGCEVEGRIFEIVHNLPCGPDMNANWQWDQYPAIKGGSSSCGSRRAQGSPSRGHALKRQLLEWRHLYDTESAATQEKIHSNSN